MFQHALKYLGLGFSVIPLKPKSKEPLIKWEEYQKRLPTEKELGAWWKQEPGANIGIVTGKLSGLTVLDADGSLGISFLQSQKLQFVPTVLSGCGKHLYFKWAEGLKNSQSKLAPGVDVRGEGGYVVAPPSIHLNGCRYRWATTSPISALPTLPTRILEILKSAESIPKREDGASSWVSEALEELKNGHVHSTLVSVLGKFRSAHFSEEDTYRLLLPYALENGKPFEGLRNKISEIWARYSDDPSNSGALSPTRLSMPLRALKIHSPANAESIREYEESKTIDETADLETGYIKLDKLLRGGLRSSRLFTLAARTGVGKTNFVLGISKSLCTRGKRVLLFTTEMRFQEIWDRYKVLLRSDEKFSTHQLCICDEFTPDIRRLESAIEQVKPDLFIFDHINHISEDNVALGTFMQGLNMLRRKFNCPGIVVAQLNRQADWVDLKTGERVIPRMSMIKGSGTIEQASSRVLLLSEMRLNDQYIEIIGNLDKNDNGEKGLLHFGLYKNPYRMLEL